MSLTLIIALNAVVDIGIIGLVALVLRIPFGMGRSSAAARDVIHDPRHE